MNRDKQFENLEELCTWYDDIMSHYEAAFWVHYQILNKDIEIWNEAIINSEDCARVTYFVNTEYMSMVYSELLITIETLFKAELSRIGNGEVKCTHMLLVLMDEMLKTDDERCISICNSFFDYRELFEETDSKKAFINLRYIDYDKFMLDSNTATQIKELVKKIDNVYKEYYSEFDIERLLYLGMGAVMGEADLSDDEKRRLKKLGI